MTQDERLTSQLQSRMDSKNHADATFFFLGGGGKKKLTSFDPV